MTGSISGVVSSALGIPQMGATVILYNRLERQVNRVLTDDKGIFQFDALAADVYTVRVSLTRFAPALLANIAVQPGIRRVLSINLASMLSNIELVYSLPVTQGLMSDDWKWALRSSLATRPILRILAADQRDPLRQHMISNSGIFSGTRGVVNLSAGDMGTAPTLGSQPDLGTAFALATSFMGSNHFEFAGNLGYSAQSGSPAAAFRTSFSRQLGKDRTPEVAITMRQIFLTGRAGSSIAGGQSAGIPLLRTMSIGVNDSLQISDDLAFTYGATLESVQFLERLNYLSPFGKLSYNVEGIGTFEAGYSSGIPNPQLYSRNGPQSDSEDQKELSGMALFPRVSLRGGNAQVQRSQNYEIGYHRKMGSRTLSAAAYREVTTNAALLAVGAEGAFASTDVLPGLFSRESVFNGGHFQTMGYMASLQQDLGENWTVTTSYGNSGVLESAGDTLRSDNPAELRQMIRANRRHWVNTRVSGKLAAAGTRFTTSYQFLNGRALTAGHFYMTQRQSPEQGLNLYVRQPIPALGGRSTKLEATAEIRNMLAQGYQGINFSNGRRMYLMSSPRALRGGLAFIF
ncbi:MAG: carboxypeptidase-like regulatory domain-containing protein [Bryobacteraceae bacterium]|nr:carboxypeptidase-like regulatory domain-containing protein [Bryobacteraceae bacterium]